jgi:hypothetical protein
MVLKCGMWKVALGSYKTSSSRKKLCSPGEDDKFYERGWNFMPRESSLGRLIPKKSLPCGRISQGSVFLGMPLPLEKLSLGIFFLK